MVDRIGSVSGLVRFGSPESVLNQILTERKVHMAFKRGSRVRVASDRQMVWLGAGILSATVSGSVATLLSMFNAAALALRPFTIVRTRLMIQIESDQSAASELV